jgi:hypothetical protein
MKASDVLTNDLRVALSAKYGRGAYFDRYNVIAMQTDTRGMIKSCQKGTADLLGVIKGYAVAIEVKAGKDRQRESQKNFQECWERAGGVYLICRNVEETMEALDLRFYCAIGTGYMHQFLRPKDPA